MNCLAFERLLDEGAPDRLPAEALAHARARSRCVFTVFSGMPSTCATSSTERPS